MHTENQHARFLKIGGWGGRVLVGFQQITLSLQTWVSSRYTICLATHLKEVKWMKEHRTSLPRTQTFKYHQNWDYWTMTFKDTIKRVTISPDICEIIVLTINVCFAQNIVLKKIKKALGWCISQNIFSHAWKLLKLNYNCNSLLNFSGHLNSFWGSEKFELSFLSLVHIFSRQHLNRLQSK